MADDPSIQVLIEDKRLAGDTFTCCFQSTALLLFNNPKYGNGLFTVWSGSLFVLSAEVMRGGHQNHAGTCVAFDPRRFALTVRFGDKQRHPLRGNQTRGGVVADPPLLLQRERISCRAKMEGSQLMLGREKRCPDSTTSNPDSC